MVAGVGSAVVGAFLLGPNEEANVEVDVGSKEDVTGVGAEAVVASNKGPKVVDVVGLTVDDEGDKVRSREGNPDVRPVMVGGNVVGSGSSGVVVKGDVMGPREGAGASADVQGSSVAGLGVEKGVSGDADGPRVAVGFGSTVVGASALDPNVGVDVDVNVRSNEGVVGVCAGDVVASNEGPNVVAVLGLTVDDTGERVEPSDGSPSVGPVVVVGNAVGLASGCVAVGDNVSGSREGPVDGIGVEGSRVDGLGVEKRVGDDVDRPRVVVGF